MPDNAVSVLVYQVDSDDRLVRVSDNWVSFASANDAPELIPENILGLSIYRYIAGHEVQDLYRLLYKRARELDHPLIFPLRCDGPTIRRYMTMHLRAFEDGSITSTCAMTRTEPRPPVFLFDRHAHRKPPLTPVCSWCNRVQLADSRWVEAEEAVRLMRWFDQTHQPRTTHSICDDCLRYRYPTVS